MEKFTINADMAKRTYEKTIGLISALILIFTVLTMLIGSVRLFYQVGHLLQADGITGNYLNLFTDVLTLFILIELSRSLFDYFSEGRVAVHIIVDVGIVFVIRHVMIELFNHKLDYPTMMALGFLLIAMGALRVAITGLPFQTKPCETRNESPAG